MSRCCDEPARHRQRQQQQRHRLQAHHKTSNSRRETHPVASFAAAQGWATGMSSSWRDPRLTNHPVAALTLMLLPRCVRVCVHNVAMYTAHLRCCAGFTRLLYSVCGDVSQANAVHARVTVAAASMTQPHDTHEATQHEPPRSTAELLANSGEQKRQQNRLHSLSHLQRQLVDARAALHQAESQTAQLRRDLEVGDAASRRRVASIHNTVVTSPPLSPRLCFSGPRRKSVTCMPSHVAG